MEFNMEFNKEQRTNLKALESLKKIDSKIISFNKTLVLGLITLCLQSCQPNKKPSDMMVFSNKHMIENSFDFNILIDTLTNFEDNNFNYQYDSYSSLTTRDDKIIKITQAIKKIPKEFIETLELKDIFILEKITQINKLTQENKEVSGLYSSEKNSIAITEYKSFFHELMHAIDHKIQKKDQEWINAIYNQGDSINPYTKIKPKFRPTGFLNPYASTGAQEDRAEIFQYLMLGSNWASITGDVILQKKIKTLKIELKEVSNGLLNNQFWKKIKNEKNKK